MALRVADAGKEGEVWITERIKRAVGPYFDARPADSPAISGAEKAGVPFLVTGRTGLQSRLEAAEQRGLTQFIGREGELEILASCHAKALGGEGQFVTVAGEAGVGKSRLLLEFQRQLGADKSTLWVGRCQAPRVSVPYVPFVDALRSAFLPDEDLSSGSRDRLVERVLEIDPELEPLIPFYVHLLSITDDRYPLPAHLEGDDLRFLVNDSIVAITVQMSLQQPLVLVLEDWHWSDDASQEVLRQLLEIVPTQPILVVATFRPDVSFDWGDPECHTGCFLTPLTSSLTGEIAGSVLGARAIPAHLEDFLQVRTGGNPFFVEEICRSLEEEGVLKVKEGTVELLGRLEELQLPGTVREVIRSRLDRLDPATLEVLRFASVVGRDFPVSVLHDAMAFGRKSPGSGGPGVELLMRESLSEAKGLGLIQQTRVVPEAEYRFKHALTQEVAYESLIMHRRRTLHQAVAKTLERRYASGKEEVLDLLFHHFTEAREWKEAILYGSRLASRTAEKALFAEALAILEKTVRIVRGLPHNEESQQTLVETLFEMERLCELLGKHDRQQALINQLIGLAEDRAETNLLGRALVRQAELQIVVGKSDEAEEVLRQALATHCEAGDKAGERDALRSLAFFFWNQEQHEKAADLTRDALDISREMNDNAAIVFDLNRLASTLRGLGEHEAALEVLSESLQICEKEEQPSQYAPALYSIGNVMRDLNRWDEAIEYYQKTLHEAREFNLWLHKYFPLSAMANVYWEKGEFEKSLELCEETVKSSRVLMNRRELPISLQVLAQRLLSLDREQEALPHVLEAAKVFERVGETQNAAAMWLQAADIYRAENLDKAMGSLESALGLRNAEDCPAFRINVFERLAQLSRDGGLAPAVCLGYYSNALTVAREVDESHKQGDLLNTMGIVYWSQSDFANSVECYQQGLDIFQELGDAVHEGLILNSLAAVHRDSKEYEKALRHAEDGLAVNRASGERLLEGHSRAVLGDVLSRLDDLDGALYHYEESLTIRRSISDRLGEGWMLAQISRVLHEKGEFREAAKLSFEALQIAEELSNDKLREACQDRARVEERTSAKIHH
jgi:tetratricopeptide (TPR) repeat protein